MVDECDADHEQKDVDEDRHCPSCGTLMLAVGLPSGEIVSRCPACGQMAI
jgi:ribosomal protein S27AE